MGHYKSCLTLFSLPDPIFLFPHMEDLAQNPERIKSFFRMPMLNMPLKSYSGGINKIEDYHE